MKLINKKEFAAVALDADSETFVVHVAVLDIEGINMAVHSFRAAQIRLLKANEASTTVPTKYSNYTDIFWSELAAELLEHTGINNHTIELEDSKQPPYGPIYSLGPVELETLKAYIKTNLANSFIRPFKSPAGAAIFFNHKPDGSLCLCVDYCGLLNLIIWNQYPLPLIGELLDCLGQAKQFTQLDLTNAYHRIRIRKGNEWKTAFRTRYNYFEYQVMLFGLSNAQATFQGYVNQILAEKLDVFVIVYLDNILIYTKDPGQSHIKAVYWVLDQLWKYGLFANLKKCCFY